MIKQSYLNANLKVQRKDNLPTVFLLYRAIRKICGIAAGAAVVVELVSGGYIYAVLAENKKD